MSEERKTREDFDTDSDYATYKITHPEESKNEEDKRVKITLYFKCANPRCDYIKKKEIVINIADFENIKAELKKGICPNCSKTGFKLINEEEYKKIEKEIEYKKKKEKHQKEIEDKLEKKYREELEKDLKSDISDVFKDIFDDFKNGRYSFSDLTKYFYNMSFRIAKIANNCYRRKYFTGFIDFKDIRKMVISIIDISKDLYNAKIEYDDVLKECEIEEENLQNKLKEIEKKYETKYGSNNTSSNTLNVLDIDKYNLLNKKEELEISKKNLDKIETKSEVKAQEIINGD